MKLHYDSENDSLYIDLSSKKSADSKEVGEGIVLDFDRGGNIVGIDIEHASTRIDLKTLELDSLPERKLKIA